MIKLIKYIFYYLLLGEEPHFHEWGNWEDRLGDGYSRWQVKRCKTCGKYREIFK